MENTQLQDSAKDIPELPDLKKTYQLDQKSYQILLNFLSFAENYKNRVDRDKSVFYNLLIIADDMEEGTDFAKDIVNQLLKRELCQNVSKIIEYKNSFTPLPDTGLHKGPKQDIALLKNCCHVEKDSSSIISSAERSDIQRERKDAETAYQRLMDFVRKNPDRTVILCVDPAFAEFIKEHETWYRCYFSHHIRIPKKSIDSMVELFKEDMEREGFTVSSRFITEYRKYLNAVYAETRLCSKTFLMQFENKVLSRYYEKNGANTETSGKKQINTGCMPYYQKPKSIQQTMKKLNSLTGLKAVKKELNNLYLCLSDKEGKKEPVHFAFEGNPGTGKTLVAELMSSILFNMGVCRQDKCITVKSSDIMSMYVGGSVNLLAEKIEDARGGVLFIDEAYFLAQDNSRTASGVEGCLELLLKCMDDKKGEVCFIFAGYPKDMQRLYKTNVGLYRRLKRIRFENYTTEELKKIFNQFCEEEEMVLAPNAEKTLEQVIENLASRKEFGNAADMRNLRDSLKIILLQKAENRKLIEITDLEQAGPKISDRVLTELVGLEDVKKTFKAFQKRAEYISYLKEKGMQVPPPRLHMIFRGNPGTGKTTVAKKIANELYQDHLLKTNRVTVAERKDLVSNSVGGTAIKTGEVIEEALNGVLFIDEAYSLARGNNDMDPGREAIETLLTAMENHVNELVVIFAGYPGEMEEFLWVNPGIRSRIGFTFNFPDYTEDELARMFKNKMEKHDFKVNGQSLEAVKELSRYFIPMDHFGNGRFIDNIIDLTIAKRSTRDYRESFDDITEADIPSENEVRTSLGYPLRDENYGDPGGIKKEKTRRRVVLHELGHYITAKYGRPPIPVKEIDLKEDIYSNARVVLDENFSYETSDEAFSFLVTLLGGRNAEQLFLGSISRGDASDYARAKSLAREMIEEYAMFNIGTVRPVDLLVAASKEATEILAANRQEIFEMLEKYGYQTGDLKVS